MSFTWVDFIAGLDSDADVAVAFTPANDGVQLRVKLGGPLAFWQNSGTPTAINSSVDFTSPEYRLVIDSVGHSPSQGSPGFTTTDWTSQNPMMAAAARLVGSELKYSDFTGPGQETVYPGIAYVDQLQLNSNTSTTDTQWFEAGLETNPDSTASVGYSGYTWFDIQSSDYIGASTVTPVNAVEMRLGLIESSSSIDDPAFDGTKMRYGLWARKSGGNYLVDLFVNGASVASASLPFATGLDSLQLETDAWATHATAPDGYEAVQNFPYVSTDHNAHVFNGGALNGTVALVNMQDVKYAGYIKPDPSNAAPFQMNVDFYLITNPAMTPASVATRFWKDKVKCSESDS